MILKDKKKVLLKVGLNKTGGCDRQQQHHLEPVEEIKRHDDMTLL